MAPDNPQTALDLLREEMASLGVDDILALCYAPKQSSPNSQNRLRVYLDVLRKRGGERAQFASCLVCFDLARQGDLSAQADFVMLAQVMRMVALREEMVNELVGGDPYLQYLWELCQAQLSDSDPRFVSAAVQQDAPTEVASLDLISDDDFDKDLVLNVETSELWLRFDEAVESFLGGEVGIPVYDPTAGFRLRNGRDVERIEAFLQELESIREHVPPARGYRALVLIFYATHTRSKNLFGQINQRKQLMLRAGLTEFLQNATDVWDVVGVMGPMHAEPEVWDKIADVLHDYAVWCLQNGTAQQGPEDYDAVGRLIVRDGGRGNWRRSHGM